MYNTIEIKFRVIQTISWELIPVKLTCTGITDTHHADQMVRELMSTFGHTVARWNYAGLSQGHYISIEFAPISYPSLEIEATQNP